MTDVEPVGIVGWGRMGRAMGRRFLAPGWPVHAYDVADAARSHVHEDGAMLGDSPGGWARQADAATTMLPGPTAIVDAASGPGILATEAGVALEYS